LEGSEDGVGCCLIVATIARVEPLDRLLTSLARQRHKGLRVVLVDQNGDDRLDALVTKHASAVAIDHLKIPAVGVSAARNAGLARMRDDEIVAFPDDDCFYDALTLANVAAVFTARPEVGVVMGSLHLPQAAETQSAGHVTVDGQASAPVGRHGLLRSSRTFTLFFRRTIVDRVGGFDVTFGPGTGSPWLCGEDTDFLIRAHESGALVVRAPQIRLYHPEVDAISRGHAAKAFGYGRGRMRLLRKHRFSWWFQFANLVHPLISIVWSGPAVRRFRWHLYRGRQYEWVHGERDVSTTKPGANG
jgi:GT2 family glycosyltransferase